MNRAKPRFDWRAAFVGGVVVALLVATAPVVADTGDSVLIGRFNTGDRKTTLTASVAGDSALKVANTAGNGSGITVQVSSGQAPFVVNSSKRVKKLNADRVDGLSSEHLAPKVLTAKGESGGLDLSAQPTICQTPTYTPVRKELAVISTNVSIQAPASGLMTWLTKASVSTNGGTFTYAPPDWWLATTSAPSEFTSLTSVGIVELEKGYTYSFGATVDDYSGESITSMYVCKTIVELFPRVDKTGDITPFDGGPAETATLNN